MAGLQGLFDPNAEPDSGGFEVLPSGQYTVKVTNGEMRPTKKNDGQYMNIEMTVVEGPHSGAKVFSRFNLVNPSKEAVRIANSQFAALREAIGVRGDQVKDFPDLMGSRFQIVVKCERRSDKPDEMQNTVSRYIKRGQNATTPQQHGENAPWSRNAPNAESQPPKAQRNDEWPAQSNDADAGGVPF